MAAGKIPGREREPIANAARSLLNSVKTPDFSKSSIKDPKAKDVIDKVIKCFNDNAKYDKDISNAAITAAIEQIRTLLNQLNKEQIQPALEEIKDEVSSTSLKNILGNVLMSQITGLFDDDAKKEDIEELKGWMTATFGSNINNAQSGEDDAKAGSNTFDNWPEVEESISSAGEVQEDNEEGDYKDSTPAKNFSTLQDFVDTQFDDLNKKLKNIPGQSGILSRISSTLGKGISSILGGIGGIAKKTLGIFGAVGAIGAGIKGLGSKIGSTIASPFKKVGGFFKSLNPFKSSEDKAAKRRESAKDKIFNFIAKVVDKIWKVIEPFVDKVSFFMGLITKFVIVPIAIIMAKILLVVAAITAIGVAAYLAYKWVKEKISKFWKYITSGELLDDIIAGLVKAQEWLWKQLVNFWNWAYSKFIGPYIVEPIKKVIGTIKSLWEEKIKPIVQPFIDSLMNLYEKIKAAFSAWDTNKSIWENLKNIGSIIVDSVKQWWETSPFKEFYDKYLDPIVKSLGNLMQRIKTIWNNFKWDENKSFFENLKCLATIVVDAVKSWWNDPENPVKKAYNKYIKPIVDKIKEVVAPIVEKIKEIWNSLKVKMGNIVLKVPFFGFVRPFGPMAGLPFKLSDSEAGDYEKFGKVQDKLNKNIEKAKEKNVKVDKEIAELESRLKTGDYGRSWTGFKKSREDVEKELQEKKQERFDNNAEIILAEDELKKNQAQQAKELAQQQVEQAMKPIESMSKMKAEGDIKLQQQGQQMSQQMQDKEQKQQKYDAMQYSFMQKIYDKVEATDENVTKQGKNPTVLPMPYPTNNNYNEATMRPMHSFITTY